MNNKIKPTPASQEANTLDNSLAIISQQQVLDKTFTIYGTYDNPLFCAKDVAEWIDYSDGNTSKMLSSVDEDEKVLLNVSVNSTCNNFTSEGNKKHNKWFLTEDGLYEVLMQSTKPIAKSFKKEVKKILKELRIKGCLPLPPDTSEMVSIHRNNLEVLEIIAEVSTAHLNNLPRYLKKFEALLNPYEAMCFKVLLERHKWYHT